MSSAPATGQPITIVMASDNFYAILIAPLLKSIEMNHKTGELLDFYIIDDEISTQNKQKLQATIDPAMSSLHWVKASEAIFQDIKVPVDKTAFPLTAYLRLFAPYVVPADRDRVIYLDCDMLVLEDISTLWKMDTGGKAFAAVQDLQEVVSCSWGGVPNYEQLGIPADSKYFNSGLLLIDAKKWKADKVTHKVIQCLIDNQQYVNWVDQYGLNAGMANQWHELDKRWNWYAIQADKTLDGRDPAIIHFLDIKPIFKSYASNKTFQAEFYKYMKLTPWKKHQPVSDYVRVIRKVYNKVKKAITK